MGKHQRVGQCQAPPQGSRRHAHQVSQVRISTYKLGSTLIMFVWCICFTTCFRSNSCSVFTLFDRLFVISFMAQNSGVARKQKPYIYRSLAVVMFFFVGCWVRLGKLNDPFRSFVIQGTSPAFFRHGKAFCCLAPREQERYSLSLSHYAVPMEIGWQHDTSWYTITRRKELTNHIHLLAWSFFPLDIGSCLLAILDGMFSRHSMKFLCIDVWTLLLFFWGGGGVWSSFLPDDAGKSCSYRMQDHLLQYFRIINRQQMAWYGALTSFRPWF